MTNQKFIINEANLSNFDELAKAISKVLDDKNIPAFTGGGTNHIRDWFSKKYIQAIKDDEVDLKSALQKHSAKPSDPEWMKKNDIVKFTGNLPNDIVDEINHICDYFQTLQPIELKKINKEPYKIIKDKVRDWDEDMASASEDTASEDKLKKNLRPNVDYKLLHKSDDGASLWVKLLTPAAKDVEGTVMGHCVGGESYENEDIYSMWDRRLRSHITLQVSERNKNVKQIKGKSNRAPVEKYVPACIDFICSLINDGFTVEGDGENIGMVKYNSKYYFDDLSILPEKYKNLPKFREWVDKIYPTEVFPKQQKALEDIRKRIQIVDDTTGETPATPPQI